MMIIRASGTDRSVFDLQRSLDLESLWQANLRLLDATLRYHSCSLHVGIENFRATESRHRVVAGDYFNYESASWVRVSGPFLETHPRIKIYTYEEVLREDPIAPQRRLEKEGVLSAWSQFVHLAFWNGRDPVALLSVRRTAEQGDFSPAEREFFAALHPMVEAGLDRIRTLGRERSRSFALERYLRKLPVPALLLDARGKLAFATQEAYERCALWNHGARSSRAVNARDAFRLPEEVAKACCALRTAAPRQEGKPGSVLQVKHARRPGMCARVELCPNRGVFPAEAVFLVTFLREDCPHEREPRSAAESMDLLRRLTPSEREVAQLIAEGLRNHEISKNLGKSLRTVEFQLNAIYRKLGIRGRTNLARLMIGCLPHFEAAFD